MNNKNIFILFYPYKLSKQTYKSLELDYIQKYCKLEVLDLSTIVSNKYSNSINLNEYEGDNKIKFTSVRMFLKYLNSLRKIQIEYNICVLNELRFASFYEALLNICTTIFFYKTNINVIDLYNGGIIVENEVVTNENFLTKMSYFIKKKPSIRHLSKQFLNYIFYNLTKLIGTNITHRLVAGESWLNLAKKNSNLHSKIKIIHAHSSDYSNYIRSLNTKKNIFFDNYALLLDGAGPMYKSDEVLLGSTIHVTAEKWYPSLNNFFNNIESLFKLSVIIAGHYKTNYSSKEKLFDYRNVYYEQTLNLVKQSKIVITRMSTAISYAVLFRKPIIFIYSNELSKDQFAMNNILYLSNYFQTQPVNIDSELDNFDISFNIDDVAYKKYINQFLTSDITSKRPNYKIILEDVMRIKLNDEL